MPRKLPLPAAGSAASDRRSCPSAVHRNPQPARFDDRRAVFQASRIANPVHHSANGGIADSLLGGGHKSGLDRSGLLMEGGTGIPSEASSR
jgi:hypothetical protein